MTRLARLSAAFSRFAVCFAAWFRPVYATLLVVGSLVAAYHRDYGLATYALVWVLLLEATDPRRPGRVIVLRSKR